MKCYACGGTYKENIGTLSLYNKTIGTYNIYDANYYKCESCEKILYPKDTILKIESAENEIKSKLIRHLPIDEFVLASEAAELLEISKQAFNKNRRIRSGFIYSATLGGKKFYNKKSILQFKESGDGRFALSSQKQKEVIKFVFKPLSIAAAHANYKKTVSDIPEYPHWGLIIGASETNQQLLQ